MLHAADQRLRCLSVAELGPLSQRMPMFSDGGAGGEAPPQLVADWLASHISDESTLPGELQLFISVPTFCLDVNHTVSSVSRCLQLHRLTDLSAVCQLRVNDVAESMVSSPTNHGMTKSKYDHLPPAGQYLQGELCPGNQAQCIAHEP